MKTILVTGGAGYVGSHMVRELARLGYRPVTFDNLQEGHRDAVLAGDLVTGDLADEVLLDQVFDDYPFEGVMHFASRCYVGESMDNPSLYYEQNLVSALTLLRVMLRHGVHKFILSSTGATYGNPLHIPIDETHPQDPVNPYGETKFFLERILKHYGRAYQVRSVSLRYFNAAGASLDGHLGEAHDPETHLIPRLLQVANGQLEKVEIYGADYPTDDGSCIRDYIHVVDLVSAHMAAFRWLDEQNPSEAFNLGTGAGHSVKEVVKMARQVTGREISVQMASRRPGDPVELVADVQKIRRLLDWEPTHSDLKTIVETAWKWEQNRRY